MMSRTFSEVEPRLVRDHLHVGIELGDRDLRRLDLRHADPIGGVQDLPLQVRRIDRVVVDEADRPDAGGGQVEPGRRAEATGAQAQHLRPQQLGLPFFADLGQHRVARVAQRLLRRHHERPVELQTLALPGREPARHRLDVAVAEVGQRPGRQRRPRATRAVKDDLRRALGHLVLDALLEEPARDPARARDVPLGPLVLLTNVDQDGPRAVAVAGLALEPFDRLADPCHVGLADPCLHVLEVLAKTHGPLSFHISVLLTSSDYTRCPLSLNRYTQGGERPVFSRDCARRQAPALTKVEAPSDQKQKARPTRSRPGLRSAPYRRPCD